MITTDSILTFIPTNSTLIVGFSGGPDSVCLLTFLQELAPKLNLKLIAAHFDHQWRQESAKDAAWCKKFCEKRSIAFECQSAPELNFSIKYNGSKEELGRKMRRTFFEKLATKYQADRIALAHHADDQLETFFIRLARGSSIAGLSGMKMIDGLYFRPLLYTSKEEILNYLQHHNIDFLTDQTNTDPKYLRNRIRYNLMPKLQEIDSRFAANIKSCMNHLEKTNIFLDKITTVKMHQISHLNGIRILSFLELDEVLQHRILMQLFIENKIPLTPSSALFQELLRFLQNDKNSIHKIHPKVILLKKDDYFYFKSL